MNFAQEERQFVPVYRDAHTEYTVEAFSATRFGSQRARPDHEVRHGDISKLARCVVLVQN